MIYFQLDEHFHELGGKSMRDKCISRKLKAKPVYENNWVTGIAGVKRAVKRRMDKLRVEVGVNETLRRNW